MTATELAWLAIKCGSVAAACYLVIYATMWVLVRTQPASTDSCADGAP